MSLISGSGLGKQFGTQLLFRDAALSLEEGARIGLIGANGTGKSTLLRIFLGLESDFEGTLARRKDLRIATLEQDPTFPEGATVRESLLEGHPELVDLERRMREIHESLADGADSSRLLARLADLETRFEHLGGYTLENRADRLLEAVGFPKSRHDALIATLSGGERNRVAFARLLLQQPDLWLLDEPTNHLDLDGILNLEEMLAESPSAAVVISHDRRFLDRVTAETWEIEGGEIRRYPGSYSRARALREERLKSEAREFEKQQAFIEKEDAFIRRYQAGQRARQAMGRRKRLERLERLDRPFDRVRVMSLSLPSGEKPGRRVLSLRGLTIGFGERTLFRDLAFELEAGETLGVVGPNGAGKTSLLRALLQPLPEATWASRAKIGTLAQHEEFPDEAETPFTYLRSRESKRSDQELRDVLAAMLFRSDDVDKPVSALSGGERKRLMLTRLLLEGNNVLLLDEPTNHLDLPSREALELALSAYEGTLLVVSHDRYFLDQMADRILWIEDGEWHLTEGGFQEALEKRRKRRVVVAPVPLPPPPPPAPKPASKPARAKSPLAKLKTEELESRIISCEERVKALESQFADPAVFRNAERVHEIRAQIKATRAELAGLEAEYAARDR